jgi:recombination protein RecA
MKKIRNMSTLENTIKDKAKEPKTGDGREIKLERRKPIPSRTSLVGNKDIQNLMNSINKTFGLNAVRLGADLAECNPMIKIPTSNPSLDIDLGGGIPIGRFTEISGAYSSTKTTQSIHIMRNAIEMGLKCSFHDAEGTSGTEDGNADKKYFGALGIDTDDFIYTRPDSLEECTDMILSLQKSGLINVAFWDSIAMTEPNKVLASDMDETVQMGVKQKLLGEFFAKYQLNNNKLVREGKTPFTLIATNQLREKIGGYGDLN